MGNPINKTEQINSFCEQLKQHAQMKATLYDGVDKALDDKNSPDVCLRYATEELGEIASALTRKRVETAKAECIDLAHCAMLVYLSLLK